MMKNSRTPAARVAFMGVLFALALVLSLVESAIPLPLPLPGVKLGLSNIVVMFCLFSHGAGSAYCLGTLKALFVLATRSPTGALLSLLGGMVSVTAMWAAMRLGKGNYGAVSVIGAVAHNMGQLAGAVILLREGAVLWYYLPLLAAVGILVGMLTAVLLRAVMPVLGKVAREPRREADG